MKTSVIIPTMNRIDSLGVLLQSIFKQTILPDEIIIIDQSEKSYQSEVFKIFEERHFHNLKYVHDKNITGLTQAKNKGIDLSTSDILFFFDDDLELYPDFIEKMVVTFKKFPEIGGLCGRQHLKKKLSPTYVFIRDFFKRGPFLVKSKTESNIYIEHNIDTMYKLSGGITAYRKIVTDKYRFDECLVKYCLGEDADYSYRVSQEFILGKYNDAVAHHHHDESGRYDMKKDFDSRVCFYYYFFKKNVEGNDYRVLNRWYLVWVLFGVFIDALNKIITKKNTGAIQGFFSGLSRVKNNFKGAVCIDYKALLKGASNVKSEGEM